MFHPLSKSNTERYPRLRTIQTSSNIDNPLRCKKTQSNMNQGRLMRGSPFPHLQCHPPIIHKQNDVLKQNKLTFTRRKPSNCSSQHCHMRALIEVLKPSDTKINEPERRKIDERCGKAAVIIQKLWRGYITRKKQKDIASKLHYNRTNEYMEIFCKKINNLEKQIQYERKVRHVQIEMIKALSRNQKVSSTSVMESASHTELAKTCSNLTNEIHQLQDVMVELSSCVSMCCNIPVEIKERLSLTNSLNLNEGARNGPQEAISPEVIPTSTSKQIFNGRGVKMEEFQLKKAKELLNSTVGKTPRF